MILPWLSTCYFVAGLPSNNFQTLGYMAILDKTIASLSKSGKNLNIFP